MLIDRGKRLEGFAGNEFEVVDAKAFGRSLKLVACCGEVTLGTSFSGNCEVVRREQSFAQARGVSAVFKSEVSVAGRHREAVFFPKGIGGNDFDIEGEISDHTANDGQLLVVLFSKDSEVGLDEVEEFENDGANAVEVTGAAGSAEMRSELFLKHLDGVVFGVKICGSGVKDMIHPLLTAFFEIGSECLRVILQVFWSVELQRIDKNRGNDSAFLAHGLTRFLEETGVPWVQGAHRRDESHWARPVYALV